MRQFEGKLRKFLKLLSSNWGLPFIVIFVVLMFFISIYNPKSEFFGAVAFYSFGAGIGLELLAVVIVRDHKKEVIHFAKGDAGTKSRGARNQRILSFLAVLTILCVSISLATVYQQTFFKSAQNLSTSTQSSLIALPINTNVVNLSKGLVGYWPLNDGNDTIAKDASGNDGNGRLVGNLAWQSNDCKFTGLCLAFDGKSGYVSIPNSEILMNISQGLTWAIWFNLAQNATEHFGLASQVVLPDGPVIDMYFPNPSVLRYEIGGPGGICDVYTGSIIQTYQWYEATMTYDSSSSILHAYLDGKPIGECTAGIKPIGDNATIQIGNYAGFLDGWISEFVVFNRPLSVDEVQTLYSLNTTLS